MFPRGRVVAVRGVEAARRLDPVVDVAVERVPGDRIDDVHDGRSRPGYVLVSGRDRDEVQRTLAQVRSLIRVDYEDAMDVAPFTLAETEAAHAHP
jgi:hypothetical protein